MKFCRKESLVLDVWLQLNLSGDSNNVIGGTVVQVWFIWYGLFETLRNVCLFLYGFACANIAQYCDRLWVRIQLNVPTEWFRRWRDPWTKYQKKFSGRDTVQHRTICGRINRLAGDVEGSIRLVVVVLLWRYGVSEGYRALFEGSTVLGPLKSGLSSHQLLYQGDSVRNA